MLKKTYLSNRTVGKFVDWLSKKLNSDNLQHSYIDRKSNQEWRCSSIANAFELYKWPVKNGRSDFQSNTKLLNELKKNLNDALAQSSDRQAKEAAVAVMKWGGVTAGNVRWLQVNQDGLAQQLKNVQRALNIGDYTSDVLIDANLRFNAGMTKVFSLICDDFIIYDSRVAAALGWLVVKFCKDEKLTELPEMLKFPWAPAKESKKQKYKKCRNPSEGAFIFPKLQAGSMHAEWNLKASWLLKAALEKSISRFSEEATPLRALEASLFMIGYDLVKNGIEIEVTEEIDSDPEWIECFTLARSIRFEYRLVDNRIEVRNGVSFTDQELNMILTELWNQFGDGAFPLSNSATKVRSGEAEPGLGCIYFQMLDKNPPDTSKLAAILMDLCIFYPDQAEKRRNMMWRLDTDRLSLNNPGDTVDIRSCIINLMQD